jgi:hypothetical protein
MPNRVGDVDKECLLSDGNYAGFIAWPGIQMTTSHGGCLGVAPRK